MNIKLLYQKVYFNKKEWEEVICFFKDIKVETFLFSKRTENISFRRFKRALIGDCIMIEYLKEQSVTVSYLQKQLELIELLKQKYNNRLYFIGFVLNDFYLLSESGLISYLSYYDTKKSSLNGYPLVILLLKDISKFIKLLELNKQMFVPFINGKKINKIFSFFY